MFDQVLFVYSVQGSHYFQVGKDLYLSNKRFKELVDQYDRAANALIGYCPMSIKDRFSCYQLYKPNKYFISCVKEQIKYTFDSNDFWDIVRKPIRFSSTVTCLDTDNTKTIFVDVGPDGSSFNFIKKIMKTPLMPIIARY